MVLLAVPESPATRLKRGILGYWSLDGAGGAAEPNRFPRVSPFDMAVTGTVSSAAGPSANLPLSRASGGGANYVSTPDSNYLPSGACQMTAAGWIFLASKTAVRPLIAHNQATGNLRSWSLEYENTGDRFRFICDQAGTNVTVSNAIDASLGSPSTSVWHFLVGIFDGARAQIRVNNLAPAFGNPITGLFDSTETMRIMHNGSVGLVGRASQVGLWNRVLSETEIQWLYNNGQGRDLLRGC